MPKLIIDEREIEVPQGVKVIEAAERLGIVVPRFCYHPALGSVGACRVCAVKFREGPIRGIQMSCMVDALDDMVISTTDAEVVDFRRHVIEWLMLNHPHDCPVCDEGGHCLLQDLTIAGGHGLRRYLGHKRTYADQDLGPLVQHEMNRCIHCYRCSRFYQEFCGYRDLGAMQLGNRTYFGRFKDGPLQSPFSGNLSDLCPTGVYTDKPSRFKGRRWDYERTPSICLHCSLGCHIVVSARYREIVRLEARFSRHINGHFICDRGRFGFYYDGHASRPREARVDGTARRMEEALSAALEKLTAITDEAGPGAVACAGGRRSSLETQHAMADLCQSKGWMGPTFFSHRRQAAQVHAASRRIAEDSAVSLNEVASADFVLAVGTDFLNEAPMLALALRQAQRNGADIVVIDPRPLSPPFAFEHLPLPPFMIDRCLAVIWRECVDPMRPQPLDEDALAYLRHLPTAGDIHPSLREDAGGIAVRLGNAQRPVIVCGTEVAGPATVALAADGVRILKAAGKAAGLFYVLPGPNAYGAALCGQASFDTVLTCIEAETVKALIVVEWDPLSRFGDRSRVERALEKLDLLVVLDHLDSPAARKADIMLPTATVFESGGLFINQEGRLQAAPQASRGGPSIAHTGGGAHPPRDYRLPSTGPEHWPAWRMASRWSGNGPGLADGGRPARPPDGLMARMGLPPDTRVPEEGIRLATGARKVRPFQTCELPRSAEGEAGPALLTVEWTFGTEALSAVSPPLQKVAPPPCLGMHPEDAAGLNIAEGDHVTVATELGEVTVAVRLYSGMARNLLLLPRHHRIAWQIVDMDRHPMPVLRLTRIER